MPRLLAAERAGERLKFVHFWGHTPPASGGVGPHVFSQWYEHTFEVDGVRYPTAEHYMMAEKARLFSDHGRLAAILDAASPGAAKAIGRGVEGFDGETWNELRFDIVARCSEAKFASSDDLRTYIVSTTNRVLVEASPRDTIWGVGMDRNDPNIERPSAWKGLNLLGFALMAARSRL